LETMHFIFQTVRQAFADADRALVRRPDLKDPAADELSGLFNLLHLLTYTRPRRLVPTLGLVNVSLRLSDKHFEVFVLLHQK
jgi:hypothetical protein